MDILWTMLIGLVVGALAKLIVPGRDRKGILITIILGIAGALVATFLGKAVGWYEPGDSAGFIAATLGAILILVVYHLLRRSSRRAA
jgi:uncharacterized membrane protein YeaQ/YmgE (transglycosylase-associated protein family)